MDYVTITTLTIFILTYIGIAVGKVWFLELDRTGIALLGAIAMLAFNCISLNEAVRAVNMPSILLLFALMVIASELHFAGFYHKIASAISLYLDKPKVFLAILMATSGVLSAFLNNDVICFAFAPVVISSTLDKRLNPIPFLMALALSSNIGCTLTFIGNAQNVLIGQMAHLNFGSYMLWVFVPIVLSMAATYFIIIKLGFKNLALSDTNVLKSFTPDTTEFSKYRTFKGLGVALVVVLLFFSPLPKYLVALCGAGLLLCNHSLKSKEILSKVDWQLLVLFVSLFVLVGAFSDTHLASKGVEMLRNYGINLDNVFTLSIVSAILSNVINNSAAVMLLVHVTDLSNPINAYALALSNSFAGNLFLIGSMANIIVVQSASNFGINISFKEFARYGVPTALASFGILLFWIWLSV